MTDIQFTSICKEVAKGTHVLDAARKLGIWNLMNMFNGSEERYAEYANAIELGRASSDSPKEEK